jgi:hypothetical protein
MRLEMASKGKVKATLASSEAEDWAAVKFREMLRAVKAGSLSKTMLIKATIVRLIAKLRIMLNKVQAAVFPAQAITKAVDDAVTMEGGWRRRGYGATLTRTFEIWTFALGFFIREAKIRRVCVCARRSAALHES